VVRRPAVRWLAPGMLLRTGVRVALASTLGAFSDHREVQDGPSFAQDVFDHAAERGEYWLDYVSDTGDGFDATYSVASLLGRDLPEPGNPGRVLCRGDVLVMGGDEVYPVGGAVAYEDRTTSVFAMASPVDPPEPPVLYAVPGNHDWYDGLTAFLRVFGQGGDIGSWRTQQARSYFALRLPRNWWLLGIDIQLDTYIDKPQLSYFRRICQEQIDRDASLILCTAKPSWYRAAEGATSMSRLLYFLRAALGPKAANVRLVLTGDSHHYVRYSSPDTGQQLVTAGHGGAFTSATHRQPRELRVPAALQDPSAATSATATYVRAPATWPPEADSRSLARGVLWRLVPRNWQLLPLFAALYWVILAAGVQRSWLWTASVAALVGAGCLAFPRVEHGGRLRRLVFGAALALLELTPLVLAGILGARAVARLPSWGAFLAGAGAGVLGGLLAAELLAVWLLWAGSRGVSEMELFSAQSIEDFKGFLRIRIATDGVLTVFPLGLRRSVREWRVGDDGRRLLPAAGELDPQLIEPPFDVLPWPAGGAADGGRPGS
jgi:hypothetical protein